MEIYACYWLWLQLIENGYLTIKYIIDWVAIGIESDDK